ncbi:MAG TPA: acylphosphatase [Tepidisphaeraceae bacterium]|nr:acylphosphatase [Tepidisphaeraceae bacterium]
MQRRTCHFAGRVQGVGFRYTVQNIAQQYNVGGYVKNLPDGRVELVMEGPERELDEVLDRVSRRMNGFIAKVDLNDLPATGGFDEFRIAH